MQRIRQFARRLAVLVRRDRFDRDLEREMRFHLEMQAEENRDDGMAARDAIDAARRRFGNTTLLREACRDAWGWGPLERAGQDLKYAARTLRRHATFTAVAVSVLALAIGANTAVFSAVSAFLVTPLPFPEPDRLVLLGAQHEGRSSGAHYRDFLDWRQRSTVFEDIAIVWRTRTTLTGFGDPQRIEGGLATSGFIRVLGVQPIRGRFFSADEDRPGAPRVLVLAHAAWQRRFGGRPDVLGRAMVLNGRPHTIVGVMPPGAVMTGDETVEFWTPLRENPAATHGGQQYREIMARLKPGLSLARARTNMSDIARQLAREDPHSSADWTVAVTPALSAFRTTAARPIIFVFAIVVFVLMLACANVAGLMLARASSRSREMAVRASLGASRFRLMRQVLTESLLLSVLAAAVGLVVARCLLGVIAVVIPPRYGYHLDTSLHIDSTVLALTLVTAVLTGLIFGMAPAWYGARTDLNSTLKGAPAGMAVRSRNRLLSSLVVGEVALALVLLIGGGLLTRDLLGLVRADTGVQADHLLTFLVNLPSSRYPSQEAATRFYHNLVERLRRTRGVRAAAGVSTLPMGGNKSGGLFEVEGRSVDASATRALLYYSTPGYFRTVGIPLLRGRDFDEHDTAASPDVAIVDDTLVRRCFPHEDPLGRVITLEDGSRATIVGVVGAIRHDGPWYKAYAQIHFPLDQSKQSEMFVAVRSTGDPAMLAGVVQDAVHALDRDLPLERVRTMEQAFAETLAIPRMMTWFLVGFAAFGLVLAAVGLYGVVAYAVAERTHEMGVRIALGAAPRDVLALVLRKGALLAVAGIVPGVLGALAMSRVMTSLLVGVSSHDVAVFTAVPLMLLVVALAASYLPARRATKVDPLTALRCE